MRGGYLHTLAGPEGETPCGPLSTASVMETRSLGDSVYKRSLPRREAR